MCSRYTPYTANPEDHHFHKYYLIPHKESFSRQATTCFQYHSYCTFSASNLASAESPNAATTYHGKTIASRLDTQCLRIPINFRPFAASARPPEHGRWSVVISASAIPGEKTKNKGREKQNQDRIKLNLLSTPELLVHLVLACRRSTIMSLLKVFVMLLDLALLFLTPSLLR